MKKENIGGDVWVEVYGGDQLKLTIEGVETNLQCIWINPNSLRLLNDYARRAKEEKPRSLDASVGDLWEELDLLRNRVQELEALRAQD